MTAEEFIDAIRVAVQQGAIEGTISLLEAPPGRRPAPLLADAGAWFRGLSAAERARAEQILAIAVHQAVFGMLCVIDGVRAVEHGPNRGRFVLAYRQGGHDTELNVTGGPMLHDLFNATD